MRLQEAKKYCRGESKDPAQRGKNEIEIIEGEYDSERWFELVKGLENEPEKGERCRVCYEMRLAKTAEFAVKNDFQVFATTLSISPHKNSKWLNEIGKNLEQKFEVKFLEADWKKCDGFKKSLELSNAAKLQRQNYCGCAYSKR